MFGQKLSRRCAPAMVVLGLACLAPAAGASCADPGTPVRAYRRRALGLAMQLGVPPGWARAHHWRPQARPPALTPAGTDVYGRALRLAPRAALALHAMAAAAARDGVVLQAVSGFRSVSYQRQLLRRKLDRGMPLAAVLRVNALPGFSEHHSGCALDLTTPGVPGADAAFASTPAFAWLRAHASEYGFRLSYPPDNPQGIDFEPWHWRYQGHSPDGTLAVAPGGAGQDRHIASLPASGDFPHVP